MNRMTSPAELVASDRRSAAEPRVHAAGAGAILFDPSNGPFDPILQQRLFALAQRIRSLGDAKRSQELVLGVNNLLFVFDPLSLAPREAGDLMVRLWETTEPLVQLGREIEIPVVYGGDAGEDLRQLAAGALMDVREYIRRHAEAEYSVASIGSMPGFAYMTGLPPELRVPRRKVPRIKVPAGTVIVGGAQAGVMPCTAPSGWHLLGTTTLEMFNVKRDPVCLLSPGDRVRFSVARIEL
ncbi:5-oxoprolinase subunit PxpB (plasmid) [Burkholderia cenocepacia]|nr:5-oxoprolinase subunit PxpB [Burkholderia cenocepacia]UJH78789.1 5-oxoprolinase subunit PxpB [Burkholderia cenocepacia]